MKKIALAFIFSLALSPLMAQNSAVNKADRFTQSGDLDKAKENIDQAVEHDKTKEKPKTWYTRGLVYEAIAMTEDPEYQDLAEEPLQTAFDAYKKAKEMEKEGGTYYVFAEQQMENIWGVYLNEGANYYQEGNYEDALVAFEKAAQFKPEDTTAYLYGGISAQQAEQYDKALENYYNLIELDYDNMDIYSSIVYLERAHNEDNEKALDVLAKARERYPDNEDLMKEEINLLITLERSDEALDKLKDAIEADAENPDLHYNLAYLYDQTGDSEKAIEHYKKAVEYRPDYFEANFNVAVNYYNQAADILREANDMDLKTYQKEGKALEEKAGEKFEQALPYLETAHEQEPEDITVLQTLQTIYSQLKMNDKAEEASEKLSALGVTEEDPEEVEEY